ncbi:MAG: chemotaxis protein CheX [Desulfuromonadaceae bacterium]|nr:chemotaxis protein CheX [Desulfuromonadaceae bacterium]
MAELQKMLAATLAKVIDETLENMAFISTEEVDTELEFPSTENMRAVCLLVTTPVVMELRLGIAEDLLRIIVETMYTINAEDITPEQIVDVLAETLNTLAGRLMTELLPTDQTFSLSLPETVADVLNSADDNTIFATRYMANGLPISIKISAAATEELKTILKL